MNSNFAIPMRDNAPERRMSKTRQHQKSQMLVLMLLLLLALSIAPSLCQSSSSAQAGALVEKMIEAQIHYDYVSLGRLEKQSAEIDKPAPVTLDSQANRDAYELLNQSRHSTNTVNKLEKFRQYAVALRRGNGICNELLDADLNLGALDTLKDDCYMAFSTSNHLSTSDCWLWYWLGLTYSVEGDNSRSVACFTIALRKICSQNTPSLFLLRDGNMGNNPLLYYHIVEGRNPSITFYPAAYRNFQQAQKEIKAELNDRDNLKYGTSPEPR